MSTKDGRVRSLYARPIQSADLAFEVPGVIAFQRKVSGKGTLLGQEVKALTLEQTIYPLLTSSLAGSQDCNIITDLKEKRKCIENKSLFKYDAEGLIQELGKSLLFALINGSLRSSLKQAILARANAFLEKYYAIQEISKFYEDIYKQSSKDKISRITELINITEEKHTNLQAKYLVKDVITDYKVTTKSGIEGDAQPDQSTTRVSILPIATQSLEYSVTVAEDKHTTGPVINAPGVMQTDKKIKQFNKDTKIEDDPKILSEKSVTIQDNRQTTTTNLVDFKHPSKDASIEYQKMQLELQDELLKHQIISKKVENMKRIMENELRLLDLDINRLQHAFLQTTLVSPIDGVITAVYKDPGDYVNPGEPVIRVENDKELLIVGFIQFRGLLKLKQKVKLKAFLFEGSEEKTIEGEIVAIRGHDADDDEWDTIIYCKNDQQIPINYHFDKDNTTIEII